MASTTELAKSWDRLSTEELDVVETFAVVAQQVSPPMARFLNSALASETGHRDSLKSKSRQVPDFDSWSDSDVADGYMAAVMIQTASAVTERLSEWGEHLMHTVCCEMCTRLHIRCSATEVMKRCENN